MAGLDAARHLGSVGRAGRTGMGHGHRQRLPEQGPGRAHGLGAVRHPGQRGPGPMGAQDARRRRAPGLGAGRLGPSGPELPAPVARGSRQDQAPVRRPAGNGLHRPGAQTNILLVPVPGGAIFILAEASHPGTPHPEKAFTWPWPEWPPGPPGRRSRDWLSCCSPPGSFRR